MILAAVYFSGVEVLAIYSDTIHAVCQDYVFEKASGLTKSYDNETNKTKVIAGWVAENIKWGELPHCKSAFWVSAKNGSVPCRTLDAGCGACGEKSELISAMLNSIGIEAVRIDASPCWGHAWNEARINNEWTLFDATGDTVQNFGTTRQKFAENHTLCNYTAYWPNGTSFDVTEKYKPSL